MKSTKKVELSAANLVGKNYEEPEELTFIKNGKIYINKELQ